MQPIKIGRLCAKLIFKEIDEILHENVQNIKKESWLIFTYKIWMPWSSQSPDIWHLVF